MLEELLKAIGSWIMMIIASMGYSGIVLLMGIESACIPLPSEIIMPFAGSLVATKGEMSLWGVSLAGAIGCVVGSIPAYYAGMYGGRKMVEKYGKWVLISHQDLDMADKAFAKYGEIIIFLGRLLPIIRTFIAFPAGVAKMNMVKFCIYTFAGSIIWCYGLAYLGMKLGERWEELEVYFHDFHYAFAVAFVIFAIWYIRRHFKNHNQTTI